MKLFPTFLLLLCVASSAFAGTVPVPEIDGNTAVSAVTLITGSLLILRRRKK